MKRLYKCIGAVLALALLTGCSGGSIYTNYREVEQLMIIQTMGFDKKGDDITVSVSTGNSGGGNSDSGQGGDSGGSGSAGSAKTSRLSAKAPSITLAQEKIQDYSASEELFFAHTSYILIGEDTAREDISRFLEYVERSIQIRLDVPVFIVSGDRADKLVLGAGGKDYDATNVLKSLERNMEKRGSCPINSVGDIAASLNANGTALVSAVRCVEAGNSLTEAKKGELTALPDGCAVIKDGRMVGHIDEIATLGVMLIQNKTGPCPIVLESGVTVQLDKCRCEVKPIREKSRVSGADISLDISAALREADKEDLKTFGKELKSYIEKAVGSALDSAVSLNCDFIQLGSIMEQGSPLELHGLAADYGGDIQNTRYNINVKAEVLRSFDIENTEDSK